MRGPCNFRFRRILGLFADDGGWDSPSMVCILRFRRIIRGSPMTEVGGWVWGPSSLRYRRTVGDVADSGGWISPRGLSNFRLRRHSGLFAEDGGLGPFLGDCNLRIRRISDLSPKTEVAWILWWAQRLEERDRGEKKERRGKEGKGKRKPREGGAGWWLRAASIR